MLGMVGFNLDGFHRIKLGPSMMEKFCGNVLRHRLYSKQCAKLSPCGIKNNCIICGNLLDLSYFARCSMIGLNLLLLKVHLLHVCLGYYRFFSLGQGCFTIE